jgi:hypothetical protein
LIIWFSLIYPIVPASKKGIGAARREYVFDVHTSKASKRLKVVLLHLWRINVKTTGGFINISDEDFHMVKKTAPKKYYESVQSSYVGHDIFSSQPLVK